MHLSRDMILTAGLSKKYMERNFEFAQLGSRNCVRVPIRKEFENLTNNPESEYRIWKNGPNFQIIKWPFSGDIFGVLTVKILEFYL